MIRARVEKKDPKAIHFLSDKYYHRMVGLQKDMQKVVGLWEEAAELGLVEELCSLRVVYQHEDGVEQDSAKVANFYKKAAMQGHVLSRHKLGRTGR